MMKEMDALTIGEPVFFDPTDRGLHVLSWRDRNRQARSEATTRVDSAHWGLSYCPRSCGARPCPTRVRADWTLIATARRAAFECAAPTGLGRSAWEARGHMSYRRARAVVGSDICRGAGRARAGWVQRSITWARHQVVRLGPARTRARVMGVTYPGARRADCPPAGGPDGLRRIPSLGFVGSARRWWPRDATVRWTARRHRLRASRARRHSPPAASAAGRRARSTR